MLVSSLLQMKAWRRFRYVSLQVRLSRDVPPLLPAYRKFMGAVIELASFVSISWQPDGRRKRPWLRIFFQLFRFSSRQRAYFVQASCRDSLVKPIVACISRRTSDLLLDGARRTSTQAAEFKTLHSVVNPPCESCSSSCEWGIQKG